jgi:hypothetical protein
MVKAETILFYLFLLHICGEVYAGAGLADKSPSNDGIDKFFNGKIMNISLDREYVNEIRNNSMETKINYLHNGVFVVDSNRRMYIVYNEYFNENIQTGLKMNENTTIVSVPNTSRYEIFYEQNQVLIDVYFYSVLDYKINMQFDENTKKLISLSNERIVQGLLDYRFSYYYEYTYDNLDRLEYVYRNYYGEKILIKSIYYDGIYRTIPRPYLYSLETRCQREIVIYDNYKIKYYIQTRSPQADRVMGRTLEEEDAAYSLLIFEYDYWGNEITQTVFRETNEFSDGYTVIYTLENTEYDYKNNWIKQNVWVADSSPIRLIGTNTRFIEYE